MPIAERFNGANIIEAGQLSPYWGEHVARYVFALPYVENKNVLDIACGTGYGLGFLKSKAKRVTGVDVDVEAAREARRECSENATVLLGDGLELPFFDSSFDVVTSFETLEHVHERGRFLEELCRVIRPDGRLILSTPNANYTRPVDGRPSNPFHVFEYTPRELKAELSEYFEIEFQFGQSLDETIRISPFFQEQERLPKAISAQSMLLGWKVMNKMPLALRENLSKAIWKKPFYPTEKDYFFSPETVDSAPVQLAVCRKK